MVACAAQLSVLIEAPEEAIGRVLDAHPEVKELFDNRWLHLFAMKEGKIAKRYHAEGVWKEERPTEPASQ